VCEHKEKQSKEEKREEKNKKKAFVCVCVFDAKNIALANNVCVWV
jgi:hypothetical protein